MCCHPMGAQKHKDCSLKRKCYIENANHKKRKKKQKKNHCSSRESSRIPCEAKIPVDARTVLKIPGVCW